MWIVLGALVAVMAAAFPLAWWLTSPRYIGRLVARRLCRLRAATRALYPTLIEVPEPTTGIIVVNRAEPASLPVQRRAEPSPTKMTTWTATVARGE
ncbi:MAG: hypothetical protein JOZ47_09945 [Kutzneria sp.]|nr:hypothetical protein [Kutzneria sp.]MBV9845379.1 hypothetical protein [Kutzneria sp.]